VTDRWFKVFQPRPRAALRLFCFPYAGGGASVYRLWPAELPAEVEVCAMQPPGRESRWRETPHRRMEAMADEAAEAILARLDLPFAFFGHSMGAALAFEVTRRLAGAPGANGSRPRHLFVSGRRAPRITDDDEMVHALPRERFIESIRGYSGTPEEVLQNEELMELVEPLLRADFEVSETYEYTPEPSGAALDLPITALGGVGDEDVSEQDLDAWRQETSGPFRKLMFDGGHFFLTERRPEVISVVRRELEALLAARV